MNIYIEKYVTKYMKKYAYTDTSRKLPEINVHDVMCVFFKFYE